MGHILDLTLLLRVERSLKDLVEIVEDGSRSKLIPRPMMLLFARVTAERSRLVVAASRRVRLEDVEDTISAPEQGGGAMSSSI